MFWLCRLIGHRYRHIVQSNMNSALESRNDGEGHYLTSYPIYCARCGEARPAVFRWKIDKAHAEEWRRILGRT